MFSLALRFISLKRPLMYDTGEDVRVGLINTSAYPLSAHLQLWTLIRGIFGGSEAAQVQIVRGIVRESDDVWKYTAKPDPVVQSSSINIQSQGGINHSHLGEKGGEGFTSIFIRTNIYLLILMLYK